MSTIRFDPSNIFNPVQLAKDRDPSRCNHENGTRKIDTFREVYLAKCNRCPRNDEYEFQPLTRYLKLSNKTTGKLYNAFAQICERHNCYMNHDFLGFFCVWCEVENILQFQNDPLPEQVFNYIENHPMYSDYQCLNCKRISRKIENYVRLEDCLKCICHLFPGVDLS